MARDDGEEVRGKSFRRPVAHDDGPPGRVTRSSSAFRPAKSRVSLSIGASSLCRWM